MANRRETIKFNSCVQQSDHLGELNHYLHECSSSSND